MTDIIQYTGLVFGILYVLICLYIFRGLRRTYRTTTEQPFISILVPARNEEQNILSCMESLSQLTYPGEKTEIIILNDRSEDNTGNIITDYCRAHPQFRHVEISRDLDRISGKMNVLTQGLEIARGEIILVTDADCRVTPGWAESIVTHFTPDTGMVGGVTLLEHADDHNGFWARLQALDWIFLQAIASGMTGAGLPVSILGNNFAFRRSAYEETGGFTRIGFSLTEDMALMQAIVRLKKWQIKYPLSLKTMLFSKPAGSLRELYQQRLRWLSGGISGPFAGWLLMITAFLTHVLILAWLVTSGISIPFIGTLMVMICADLFLIVLPLLKRLKRWIFISYFPLFEIYYFLYTTLMAFLVFLPQKVSWKKRRYKAT